MLELKNVTKVYKTGDFEQKALDDVSINFRKSEFVSILGPSGSGKTTLLNIIGGLDKYTHGDLKINEISTKKYTGRDWDTYRNHRVGFVFQSYNLINHQTILANVELALTLSGVKKNERRKRAIEALKKVGLSDHIHKNPNQLSGGQTQRVAIARALVNNPDILLADEPTGAIDSETSIQIMNILKEVAKDRLVIMVTHNAELAEKYSTRIVKLRDGHILGDTKPYDGSTFTKEDKRTQDKKSRRGGMSFRTALSLSLTNLMTKKGRTLLTAFAGSIGIIGIALILSLSTGVQNYITKIQGDTLTSYPLSIETSAVDMTDMMSSLKKDSSEITHGMDKIYSNNLLENAIGLSTNKAQINNLTEFKSFIESPESGVSQYTNDIKYSYGLNLQLYKYNQDTGAENVDPKAVYGALNIGQDVATLQSVSIPSSIYSMSNVWSEISDNTDLLNNQYDILAGKLPTEDNEIVLTVDENNEISDYALYTLGLEDKTQLSEMIQKTLNGESFEAPISEYSYDELLNLTYRVVLNTDYYQKQNGVWVDQRANTDYMNNLVSNALELKVVGIIKPSEESVSSSMLGGIKYKSGLQTYIINGINNSEIAKEQTANPAINIFTGQAFGQDESYKQNLKTLGVVDLDTPTQIDLYPKSFEAKNKIEDIISDYNKQKTDAGEEDLVIDYTDFVGVLMSVVTTIVNVVSAILIAFVAISLVVSSIMIGIITYISVIERTKEIGILRAIGASAKDVSRVFNAETFIVGLAAGLLGIGITLLLDIPANIIIKSVANISNAAILPPLDAVILVVISVFLTMIAGLIPAKIAAKKDPVIALKSE